MFDFDFGAKETDVKLTNVSVGQRLVQGQYEAVCGHVCDLAFLRLPGAVAGGGDDHLVSNLHAQQGKHTLNTSSRRDVSLNE